MPINVTDAISFTSPIQSVATGDSANQANFLLAPQGLANRTAYLNNALTTGDGSLVAGSLVIAALSSASAIPVTTALSFGTNPASAGSGLRFANNTVAAAARNFANSANIPLLGTDASNNVQLGDSAGAQGALTVINGTTGLSFKVAGTQIGSLAGASGDFLKLGAPVSSAYASAGLIRLGDVILTAAKIINGRNNGNTADVSIIAVDGTGNTVFGDVAQISKFQGYSVQLANNSGAYISVNASGACALSQVATFDALTLGAVPFIFNSSDNSATSWDFKINSGTYAAPLASFAVAQGTVNSQVGTQRRYTGYLRTTNATATTILTIPVATSGSVASILVRLTGRDVTSGTVGDGFSKYVQIEVKNVGGTVTSASGTSLVAIATTNDASMATCALSFNISGTNVLITAAGLAGVTIDWVASAEVILA